MSRPLPCSVPGPPSARPSRVASGVRSYGVALVARRLAPLEALVAELAGDGIEAAAFSADLTDQAAALAAVDAIRARFGRIARSTTRPPAKSGSSRRARLRADTMRSLLESTR